MADAIGLADWFAAEQLQLLDRGRQAFRRAKRDQKRDQVLALLADKPGGITARDVQRARIAPAAPQARDLLARMEADGELTGTDSRLQAGGHVARIYTKPPSW